ncbi:MAG: hypothetical protein WKG52_11835 [Variovorax sp.]
MAPVAQPRVIALGGNLELDDIIEVTVDGLRDWSLSAGHAPWRLVPYLDGRSLSGLYPVAVNLRTGKLQFFLRVTPESRASWNNVLSPPTLSRKVRFSVGLELQDPFETALTLEQNPATLTVIEPGWAVAALATGATFALAFTWLAAATSFLMERGALRSGDASLRFSLAKVQLAVWFFVVFGAFIVIWLATGNYDTINASIVAIFGISAGTALGDSYIKSTREGRADELVAHGGSVDSIASDGLKASPPARQFFRDLLTDSDGYSIYRFQMVAWTVVLAAFFVSGVYYDLTMPDFRPDLLYLLGLSSGTYVAHRFPETLREARNGVRQDALADPASSRSDTP